MASQWTPNGRPMDAPMDAQWTPMKNGDLVMMGQKKESVSNVLTFSLNALSPNPHFLQASIGRPLGRPLGVHWVSNIDALKRYTRPRKELWGPRAHGPKKKTLGALGPGMSMRDKDTRNTAGRKGPEKEGPRKRRGLLCTICI